MKLAQNQRRESGSCQGGNLAAAREAAQSRGERERKRKRKRERQRQRHTQLERHRDTEKTEKGSDTHFDFSPPL